MRSCIIPSLKVLMRLPRGREEQEYKRRKLKFRSNRVSVVVN